ncbi:MAG: AI-2E family transporter [Parachlamydiaceae bacterium]|nr:AI-2E family transporter [Parachlamydiaceae bacterium]
MQIQKNNAANSAIKGIYALLLAIFTIAFLYLGQDILIPLALAVLLSFFLSQFVTRLEKYVGRIISVLIIVCMVFIGISATTYIMSQQLIELAAKLPDYKTNIIKKLRALHIPQGGVLTRLSNTIEDLKKELPGQEQPKNHETGVLTPSVQVVETKKDFTSIAESVFGTFFSVLGTLGFVLLLVVLMLINREDLRGRIIRLIGQGRIGPTTLAMDDASARISSYLFMQLVVNVSFGVLVGIGLFLIGIPNAILWGGMAIVLRFIPYLGVWISSAVPIILSLAVSESWALPVITICLFLGLELVLCNGVEPWLYGSSTGVSPMALMVAAVFWTWMWGPIGLVLSTALTVCLVVLGHHVGKLEFLSILLSDEEPLKPDEECYNRLLVDDQNETLNLIEKYLQTHTKVDLYDNVLIPVITASETDLRLGSIDVEQGRELRQNIYEIVEDLSYLPLDVKEESSEEAQSTPIPPISKKYHALCLPVRAERDELAGAMLTQLLGQQSIEAENVPIKLNTEELITFVQKCEPGVIFISVVSPSTVIHARYLAQKIRQKISKLKIYVGIWGTKVSSDAVNKLHSAGVDQVVYSLEEAVGLMGTKKQIGVEDDIE